MQRLVLPCRVSALLVDMLLALAEIPVEVIVDLAANVAEKDAAGKAGCPNECHLALHLLRRRSSWRIRL